MLRVPLSVMALLAVLTAVAADRRRGDIALGE